jgi:hypothetical protein
MPLALLLRLVAAVLATWAPTTALPPAGRHAPVLTDGRQSAAALATYGGVVAWWGTAGDPRDVRLTVWRPGGHPRRLPVAANADPYRRALDVGRGPDGAVWITYARCAGRDAPGRRCQPRGYDLRTGVDRDLGVGSGVAASIWGDRVAILRQSGADTPSSLFVTTIGGAGTRRIPFAASPGGSTEIGAPTALDLRGDRVAFVAWEPGEDARGLSLRAGRLSDPASIVPVAGGGSGEECTHLVTSPTLTATALTWMMSTLGPASSCGRHRRELDRRDARGTAVAPISRKAPKQAVVAGGRVVALFAERPDDDQRDRDACQPEPLQEDSDWPGCRLRVTPAPRWGSPAPPG